MRPSTQIYKKKLQKLYESNEKVTRYFFQVITNCNQLLFKSSVSMIARTVLTVAGNKVVIHRLIVPTKRWLLSNVCLSIPHEMVETSSRGYWIKIMSSLSSLRAGILGDEYTSLALWTTSLYTFRWKLWTTSINYC